MSKEQDRIELDKWLITKGIESEKIRKIICKRAKNPKLIVTEGFEASSNSWWWEDSPEGEDFWDGVNDDLIHRHQFKPIYPAHIYDLSDYVDVKFDTYFYNAAGHGKFVNVLGEEIATPKDKIRLTSCGARVYFDIGCIKDQIKISGKKAEEPKFVEEYTSDGEKVSISKEKNMVSDPTIGYVVEFGDDFCVGHFNSDDIYETMDEVLKEYNTNSIDDGDEYTVYKLVPVAKIRKVTETKVDYI